jgi:hypothetical protein
MKAANYDRGLAVIVLTILMMPFSLLLLLEMMSRFLPE